MSNIAGKAYAMNLFTPVSVSLSYLSVFFIPGIICLLKVIGNFIPLCMAIVPCPLWVEIALLLGGIVFLGLGLAQLLGIVGWGNAYVFWGAEFICFLALMCSTQYCLFDWVVGFVGLVLLIIGFIFLRMGILWLNKFIFWIAGLPLFQKAAFNGLLTLSLIHYARWVILNDRQFPRLSESQPKEKLSYGYMFFFSNFNGSWTQYVDSFSMSIPGGLNLLWFKNIGWLYPVPETPFNNYVISNQIWTEHYYNAYPLASSNDIKSAEKVKSAVMGLKTLLGTGINPQDFAAQYSKVLLEIQSDISQMEPTPVVSLANEAILKKQRIEQNID